MRLFRGAALTRSARFGAAVTHRLSPHSSPIKTATVYRTREHLRSPCALDAGARSRLIYCGRVNNVPQTADAHALQHAAGTGPIDRNGSRNLDRSLIAFPG